jgi:hypothetical protein
LYSTLTRINNFTFPKAWNRVWTERDISTFVYGIRALECLEKVDIELLKLGAKKISKSPAKLSSRSIGKCK